MFRIVESDWPIECSLKQDAEERLSVYKMVRANGMSSQKVINFWPNLLQLSSLMIHGRCRSLSAFDRVGFIEVSSGHGSKSVQLGESIRLRDTTIELLNFCDTDDQ